jgi:hypothetical protein
MGAVAGGYAVATVKGARHRPERPDSSGKAYRAALDEVEFEGATPIALDWRAGNSAVSLSQPVPVNSRIYLFPALQTAIHSPNRA